MALKHRFTDDSYRREPWFRALCEALQSCKNEEELANFLRDIGTLSELQAWSERLEVAKLLARGLSYREVARQTGASTTTVTRVAKFIENGAGGYRSVLHTHRHHRVQSTGKIQEENEISKSKTSLILEKKSEQISVLQKYLHPKNNHGKNV